MNSQMLHVLLQVWMAGENHSQEGIRLSETHLGGDFFLITYAADIIKTIFALTAMLTAAAVVSIPQRGSCKCGESANGGSPIGV